MPRSAPSSLPTTDFMGLQHARSWTHWGGGPLHRQHGDENGLEFPHTGQCSLEQVLTQVQGKTKCILHKRGNAKLLGAT